jgi:pimeloyl-ACP methyl ester carboxylesterase
MRPQLILPYTSVFLLASAIGAQTRPDRSPHEARFVTVDSGVQLEVLDWGGSGRAVVLLAGLGGTAHDFDEFAPKLATTYHVYGITRRGFGNSSKPPFGYSADRLADDVLAAIDSLQLRRPIIAGHSMAGEELSSIGSRHSDKESALIYLDAGYDYAFYDQSHGNLSIDINEISRQLDRLRFGSGASPLERRKAEVALADTTLPPFLKFLQAILKEPVPSAARGPRAMDRIPYAVVSGEQKFTHVEGPVLAIFASPGEAPPGGDSDPAIRATIAEVDSANALQVGAFERGIPQARVIRIPRANHFVFRSNEAQVLREMRTFIDALPAVSE